MCGIAGIFRFGSEPLHDRQREADCACVDAMLRAIEYRGPDDRGIESLGRATLGAQRLAILDVAGGHQPLADAAGRVWASLNGEIYNFAALRAELEPRHRFRTRTDTELLPALWRERGPELVRDLSGMFGLAVYDRTTQRLLLARDAVGIKPLYLARLGSRLLWASELKALLTVPELPRELDTTAIAHYLRVGFLPGAATPFRAVRKLRPGMLLVATPGGEVERRYQPWPTFAAEDADGAPALEPAADCAESLIRAAAIAMLQADVPVGLLLSGGIDSSVLAALLPEERRRELRTFAIGFEGGRHYDERRFARRVAAHLGTRHRELTVTADLAGVLPRVAALMDEPCADSAAVPAHLVASAASSEVKVLLSGTGGDEVYGGYRRYRLDRMLSRVQWMPRGVARRVGDWLGRLPLHRGSRFPERLIWLRKLMGARTQSTFFAAYLSLFSLAPVDAFGEALDIDMVSDDDDVSAEMLQEVSEMPRPGPHTGRMVDHLFYLPDDLLLKEDRATMGASVEGRFPYLDSEVIRHAAGLPLMGPTAWGPDKPVLRAIARRHLPAEIALRPKHGFAVPVEAWLAGPLVPLARDVFGASGSGVFRAAVLRRWLDQPRRGADRTALLWSALCFELWWREVGAASPAHLIAAGRARPYGAPVGAEANRRSRHAA